MPAIIVKTGERTEVPVALRRVATVEIWVNGIRFATDVRDDATAFRMAVEVSRALGLAFGNGDGT